MAVTVGGRVRRKQGFGQAGGGLVDPISSSSEIAVDPPLNNIGAENMAQTAEDLGEFVDAEIKLNEHNDGLARNADDRALEKFIRKSKLDLSASGADMSDPKVIQAEKLKIQQEAARIAQGHTGSNSFSLEQTVGALRKRVEDYSFELEGSAVKAGDTIRQDAITDATMDLTQSVMSDADVINPKIKSQDTFRKYADAWEHKMGFLGIIDPLELNAARKLGQQEILLSMIQPLVRDRQFDKARALIYMKEDGGAIFTPTQARDAMRNINKTENAIDDNLSEPIKGIPRDVWDTLSDEDRQVILGSTPNDTDVMGVPKSIYDTWSVETQMKHIFRDVKLTEKQKFDASVQMIAVKAEAAGYKEGTPEYAEFEKQQLRKLTGEESSSAEKAKKKKEDVTAFVDEFLPDISDDERTRIISSAGNTELGIEPSVEQQAEAEAGLALARSRQINNPDSEDYSLADELDFVEESIRALAKVDDTPQMKIDREKAILEYRYKATHTEEAGNFSEAGMVAYVDEGLRKLSGVEPTPEQERASLNLRAEQIFGSSPEAADERERWVRGEGYNVQLTPEEVAQFKDAELEETARLQGYTDDEIIDFKADKVGKRRSVVDEVDERIAGHRRVAVELGAETEEEILQFIRDQEKWVREADSPEKAANDKYREATQMAANLGFKGEAAKQWVRSQLGPDETEKEEAIGWLVENGHMSEEAGNRILAGTIKIHSIRNQFGEVVRVVAIDLIDNTISELHKAPEKLVNPDGTPFTEEQIAFKKKQDEHLIASGVDFSEPDPRETGEGIWDRAINASGEITGLIPSLLEWIQGFSGQKGLLGIDVIDLDVLGIRRAIAHGERDFALDIIPNTRFPQNQVNFILDRTMIDIGPGTDLRTFLISLVEANNSLRQHEKRLQKRLASGKLGEDEKKEAELLLLKLDGLLTMWGVPEGITEEQVQEIADRSPGTGILASASQAINTLSGSAPDMPASVEDVEGYEESEIFQLRGVAASLSKEEYDKLVAENPEAMIALNERFKAKEPTVASSIGGDNSTSNNTGAVSDSIETQGESSTVDKATKAVLGDTEEDATRGKAPDINDITSTGVGGIGLEEARPPEPAPTPKLRPVSDVGEGVSETLVGGAGNDVLIGSPRDDTLSSAPFIEQTTSELFRVDPETLAPEQRVEYDTAVTTKIEEARTEAIATYPFLKKFGEVMISPAITDNKDGRGEMVGPDDPNNPNPGKFTITLGKNVADFQSGIVSTIMNDMVHAAADLDPEVKALYAELVDNLSEGEINFARKKYEENFEGVESGTNFATFENFLSTYWVEGLVQHLLVPDGSEIEQIMRANPDAIETLNKIKAKFESEPEEVKKPNKSKKKSKKKGKK